MVIERIGSLLNVHLCAGALNEFWIVTQRYGIAVESGKVQTENRFSIENRKIKVFGNRHARDDLKSPDQAGGHDIGRRILEKRFSQFFNGGELAGGSRRRSLLRPRECSLRCCQ